MQVQQDVTALHLRPVLAILKNGSDVVCRVQRAMPHRSTMSLVWYAKEFGRGIWKINLEEKFGREFRKINLEDNFGREIWGDARAFPACSATLSPTTVTTPTYYNCVFSFVLLLMLNNAIPQTYRSDQLGPRSFAEPFHMITLTGKRLADPDRCTMITNASNLAGHHDRYALEG